MTEPASDLPLDYPTKTENMFAQCETLDSVVFQAIGAGSVCWENLDQTGIFQSDQAKRVGEHAMERIGQLLNPDGIAPTFARELGRLINRYSLENGSNTPDHLLASYMIRALDAAQNLVSRRDHWYGVELKPGRFADGSYVLQDTPGLIRREPVDIKRTDLFGDEQGQIR